MDYKLIGKIDKSLSRINEFKSELLSAEDYSEEDFDDLFIDINYELKQLNYCFRKLTNNEIKRKISEVDRKRRADNLRKNRYVKNK